MPISRAQVIRRERTPTDYLSIYFGDSDRVPFAVVLEPLAPAFQWFRFLLVGASGIQHIMIVNVVDGAEVVRCRIADGGGLS